MSQIFEASNLTEAYAIAVKEFNCSIKELDIEIVQNSSVGFLGFFKKQAIIKAQRKDGVKAVKTVKTDRSNLTIGKEVLKEIKINTTKLLKTSCFDIEVKEVSQHNENTVFVKLEGNDVALIIGKEGYRYNSLVTLMYNWLHVKYGLLVRLEVSEFLKMQEESVLSYLQSIYPLVNDGKRVKTKILDGILLRIALNDLKSKYPNKFIRVRNNHQNKKYILIDNKKES